MLRITELRLPLDHADDALRRAIVERLRIADRDLAAFTVYKRSHDARKKDQGLGSHPAQIRPTRTARRAS